MATPLSAYIAGNKFGLGLKPGERQHIEGDPRGWLQQQLQSITQLPQPLRSMEASGPLLVQAVERLRSTRKAVESGQDKQAKPRKEKAVDTAQDGDAAKQFPPQVVANEMGARQIQREHVALRLQAAMTTDAPFAERLVRFWSNHFTVAEGGGVKRSLREIAVPYENEAIRAHLGGSFADLVLAVEQHPAMLIYLDNIQSIGPSTRIAGRGKRGLNENLAREILELHTLGVDGGYTQQDVTTLARIITGWTVGGLSENKLMKALLGEPGRFLYVDMMHEGGTQTVLGKSYRDNGVDQGKQALRDLARHPATARHIAVKLARHFVADQPPPETVALLEKTFRETEGHLPSVHAALIGLDAAWDADNRKLKTPEELLISLGRGLDFAALAGRNPRNRSAPLLQALNMFGQMPFTAPSPAGWPDVADFWGNPDALLKRIEFASAAAERITLERDVLDIYADLLPQQPALVTEISRAASTSQALALLVASPQFQWR